MPETELHKFLKKVGIAFLHNQKCFLIGTEVYIPRYLLQYYRGKRHLLDKHNIIDVCGIGEKYIPLHKRSIKYKNYKFKIIRGIEVKVSRSDFKKGFVCSGCNYHYLLAPKGLISKSELPKGVGLLEVSRDTLICYIDSDSRFHIKSLVISKLPSFMKTEEYIKNSVIESIGICATRFIVKNIVEDLKNE